MDDRRGPDRAGVAFGRYTLWREIASGGMAEIHLGSLTGPGGFRRLFAIKRIHAHLGKQRQFVEMFMDEAAIVSRISHPNVCSVVDFGEIDGVWYLAMEHLSGVTLATILRALARPGSESLPPQEPLRVACLTRVIADAARGLHAAHELRDDRGEPLGVVHRDVSPDNIFVTWEGVTKIIDFGVATARERLHTTTTGVVKGKHAYMAPEQLELGTSLDRRVDVWAMGVVGWECLCGSRLFRRDTQAQTLFAVVSEEVLRVSRARPGVDPAFDLPIERALQRDRDGRYPTLAQMADDLERAATESGLVATQADVAAMVISLLPDAHAHSQTSLRELTPPTSGRSSGEPIVATATASTAIERPPVAHEPAAAPTPITSASRSRTVALATSVGALVVAAAAAAWLWPAEPMPAAQAAGVASLDAPAVPMPVRPPDPEPPSPPDVLEAGSAVMDSDAGATAVAGAQTTEAVRGRVRVTTPGGWAEVWVRGRRVWEATPGEIALAPGMHTLELRPMGHGPPIRRAVRVVGGRTTRVSVPLTQ